MTERAQGRRRVLGAASLALAVVLLPAVPDVARAEIDAGGSDGSSHLLRDDPVRIMAFGDSITEGSGGDLTWRWYLDRHLSSAGQALDLVGPRSGVHVIDAPSWTHEYADPDFDSDHAAWWGNSFADPFDPGLRALVGAHSPDVVVINNSTNDLTFWDLTPQRSLELLRAAVLEARAADPTIDVVLCEVTRGDLSRVREFNAALPALAAELDSDASRVVLAATASDFRASTGRESDADTWDSVHPDFSGQQKIAAAVGDALAELRVGRVWARPLSPVDEGPIGVPQLTITAAQGDRLRLRWTAVDGASTVVIEGRRVSASGEATPWAAVSEHLAPAYVTSREITDLPACTRHEFRVRTWKNWTRASERYASPVVAHEWEPDGPAACADEETPPVITLPPETTPPVTTPPVLAPPATGPLLPGVTRPTVSPTVRTLPRLGRPVVTATGRRAVRVRWRDVAGEGGYQVRIRRASGPWKVHTRTKANRTSARVAGLRPGKKYRIQVRAVGARTSSGAVTRTGPWSPIRTVSTRR